MPDKDYVPIRTEPDDQEANPSDIYDFDKDTGLLADDAQRLKALRSKSIWRPFAITILVASMMTACFVGGYTLGSSTCSRMWNFDSVDIVPEVIQEHLLKPNVAKSYKHFTTAFFTADEDPDIAQHPWIQPPGPESDEFFQKRGGHSKIFLISAEDMKRLGKDPSKYVHIGKDWGYGDKIYPARFDMSHQLHCIHSLRQMLYPEHYGLNTSTTFTNPHDRRHRDHCLWALFDYVSCHVTLDVYNFKWVQGNARPFPDHASQRQCRDMDQLEKFYDEHDVSSDARLRYLVPQEGDFIHPISAEHERLNQIPDKRTWLIRHPEEWMRQRRERFEQVMAEWRETGKIPRMYDNELI